MITIQETRYMWVSFSFIQVHYYIARFENHVF